MNTASQNFPHHLGVLRQRMLHPTDYELAVNYFLEEFAGDAEFVRASDCEKMPHLVAVLGNVASKAIGRRVELEGALVSYLREHRFVQGFPVQFLAAHGLTEEAVREAGRIDYEGVNGSAGVSPSASGESNKTFFISRAFPKLRSCAARTFAA